MNGSMREIVIGTTDWVADAQWANDELSPPAHGEVKHANLTLHTNSSLDPRQTHPYSSYASAPPTRPRWRSPNVITVNVYVEQLRALLCASDQRNDLHGVDEQPPFPCNVPNAESCPAPMSTSYSHDTPQTSLTDVVIDSYLLHTRVGPFESEGRIRAIVSAIDHIYYFSMEEVSHAKCNANHCTLAQTHAPTLIYACITPMPCRAGSTKLSYNATAILTSALHALRNMLSQRGCALQIYRAAARYANLAHRTSHEQAGRKESGPSTHALYTLAHVTHAGTMRTPTCEANTEEENHDRVSTTDDVCVSSMQSARIANVSIKHGNEMSGELALAHSLVWVMRRYIAVDRVAAAAVAVATQLIDSLMTTHLAIDLARMEHTLSKATPTHAGEDESKRVSVVTDTTKYDDCRLRRHMRLMEAVLQGDLISLILLGMDLNATSTRVQVESTSFFATLTKWEAWFNEELAHLTRHADTDARYVTDTTTTTNNSSTDDMDHSETTHGCCLYLHDNTRSDMHDNAVAHLTSLLCHVGVVCKTILRAVQIHPHNLQIQQNVIQFMRSCDRRHDNLAALLQNGACTVLLRTMPTLLIASDGLHCACEVLGSVTPLLDRYQQREVLLVLRYMIIHTDDVTALTLTMALMYTLLVCMQNAPRSYLVDGGQTKNSSIARHFRCTQVRCDVDGSMPCTSYMHHYPKAYEKYKMYYSTPEHDRSAMTEKQMERCNDRQCTDKNAQSMSTMCSYHKSEDCVTGLTDNAHNLQRHNNQVKRCTHTKLSLSPILNSPSQKQNVRYIHQLGVPQLILHLIDYFAPYQYRTNAEDGDYASEQNDIKIRTLITVAKQCVSLM